MRMRILFAICSVAIMPAYSFAQWAPLQNISRCPQDYGAEQMSLAIDSFRTLHASWTHRTDDYDDDWIEYACRPANVDTWTIPSRVNSHLMYYLGSVVAIGPGHVPYVIWRSQTDSDYMFVSRRSGDTWTTERQSGWCNFALAPRAATDRFDRIHLVWSDMGRTVWYARYDASGWTRPETAACFQTHGVGAPDVAADGQGFAHVVYETFHETVGYVHQTPTGWSAPEALTSGVWDGGWYPRVSLDSLDQPQVGWWDYRITTFSGKQNDVWSPPVYLDSTQRGGLPPSVCVDRWNQVHVFFGDDDANGHDYGLREKVKDRWRWTEAPKVDTIAGDAEPLADGNRLHALVLREGGNYVSQIWYTYRDMDPPAIQEAEQPLPESGPPALSPVTRLTEISFVLDRPGRAEIAIMDCAGRRIWTFDTQVLSPGRHLFLPYSHLPWAGVFYCRIRAGSSGRTTKLVRAG